MNVKPPKGLFDRIILAIKREQELKRTRKILFGFLALLVLSLTATPISLAMLINQARSTGIYYFVSAALSDLGVFANLWQDFILAIIEGLPLTGIVAFIFSVGVSIFTLRLFLYKKRLLFGYLLR